VLARDRSGLPLMDPPVLWDIDTDPLLAGVKLIAEPWDAGGLYQVGTFIGDRWEEWNGKFRDDTRSFLKGDSGAVSNFASRMLGSPDIYGHKEREVEQSINFVCCHDGFTLNDLVSYNTKHNEKNGEQNRDGYNNNLSWNSGVEGATNDPEIERLRNRRVKTFLTANFLALGTPMLLMGDEVRRTQLGNNNAYCQDNEISWFDWDQLAKHADLFRFARMLIKSRIERPMKPETASLTLNQFLQESRVQWHGVKLNRPDWGNDSHTIAVTGWNQLNTIAAHIVFNAYHEPLEFELPKLEISWSAWHRWIDTSLDSPNDITPPQEAPEYTAPKYRVMPYSAVVLLAFNR
jgi:glycogen operon protein